MKKKRLTYGAMLAMILALAGCASDENTSTTTTTTSEQTTVQH